MLIITTTYAVVLFAALLLGGWWQARPHGTPPAMAAALWASLGMLLAVGINQPISSAINETRPAGRCRTSW